MTYGGHKVGILLLLLSALTLGCPFSEKFISDTSGAASGAGGGRSSSASSKSSGSGAGGASSASNASSKSSGSGGGGGSSVPCMKAADCPGKDEECQSRTCTGGFCGLGFEPFGTPTSTQVAKNCKVNECDGSGMVITVADNKDAPVDNNQCTFDVCTAGIPSNPNAPAGTACNQNGGMMCNGNGACVP